MSKNENDNNAINPAPEEEPVCNAARDKEAEEFQKKEKRDQTIISTAVDAILSFFEVW